MNYLKELFEISHKASVAVLMRGLPGIGKSEIVEQYASDNGYHIETLFLSQMDVGDLIGNPTNITCTINGVEETIMIWSKPEWLVNMDAAAREGKECVLLLDEFNRSNLDVRQASLELVLKRKIHQHVLPANKYKTLVIAAQNPDHGKFQTSPLDPALLSRFIVVDVELNHGKWLEWAALNKVHHKVLSYIAKFKKHLYHMDDQDEIGSNPRSWTALSTILNQNNNISNNMLTLIAQGLLGTSVGAEFCVYYNKATKMIGIDEIVNIVANKLDTSSHSKSNSIQFKEITDTLKSELQDMEVPLIKNLLHEVFDFVIANKTSNTNILFDVVANAAPLEVFSSFISTKKRDNVEEFYQWYDNSAFSKLVLQRISLRKGTVKEPKLEWKLGNNTNSSTIGDKLGS